jgi:hypothetical protein
LENHSILRGETRPLNLNIAKLSSCVEKPDLSTCIIKNHQHFAGRSQASQLVLLENHQYFVGRDHRMLTPAPTFLWALGRQVEIIETN